MPAKDSVSIPEALKARCKLEGLSRGDLVRLAGFVKTEDIEEIVQAHLIGGAPVERLVLPEGCVNTVGCLYSADADSPDSAGGGRGQLRPASWT